MASQAAQPTPYFNLIPFVNLNQPAQIQPTYQAVSANSNSFYNNNCSTPTPGSSPNPNQTQPPAQPSTNANNTNKSQQYNSGAQNSSTSSTSKSNKGGGGAGVESPIMNPYNFHHMMAMAAAAAASNNPQQAQIPPNILMMMMMGNQQQQQQHQNAMGIQPAQNIATMHQLQPNNMLLKQQQQQPLGYQPYYQPVNQLSPSVNQGSFKTANNGQHVKKKNCYNCGSMSHVAAECREPSIETSMSQTSKSVFFLIFSEKIMEKYIELGLGIIIGLSKLKLNFIF